jgi:hypothetical protein
MGQLAEGVSLEILRKTNYVVSPVIVLYDVSRLEFTLFCK